MAFHDEKIWLAVPTGTSSTNDRLLVFGPRYGWWSVYDRPLPDRLELRARDPFLILLVLSLIDARPDDGHAPADEECAAEQLARSARRDTVGSPVG